MLAADEEFDLLLTLTNTSTSPANLLSIKLPASRMSGAEVVGSDTAAIDTLLPGEVEVMEYRIRPTVTGRVVASAARSDSHINPRFELTLGVGENGIPLSPTTIVLPRSTESLPRELVRQSLGLVGLGFSLALAVAQSTELAPRRVGAF